MRSRPALALACGSALVALLVVIALPRTRAQDGDEAPAQSWRERAATEEILCNEQDPLPYLIRDSWTTRVYMDRDEMRERRQVAQQAVRFRTENYGFFTGFGLPEWNAHTPMENSEGLRLFDRPIRLNQRIIAAARCAEQEIARTCGGDDYQPRRLSGIRDRNTYHNGEVSNHVYGIAIDLDPQQNTCCNCVKEWRLHPLCQATPQTIFERMVMPECWVRGFEKYGFYWLGHDRLMDTMHFEFLGDPEHVLISDGPPPHMSRQP
ncbi:MAG: M15 family metallopeptidase [Sandaracinaceae bacterium]|nr:M15 family metallopeptidase [Sandaracinaceae bacterium]